MKKSLLYFSALAGFMTVSSCSDDTVDNPTNAPQEGTHTVTLSAGMDKGRTRSSISENGVFSWLPGDKIKVLATDNNFHELAFVGNAQSVSGDFTGTITGTQTTYAVSPSSIAPASNAGEALTVTLPSAFASVDKQTNAPMVARFDEGATNLQFRNLAGMVMFYVNNIPAGNFILTVTADNQKLSGTFTAAEDAEGNLAISAVPSETENVVTISYTGTEAGKRGFYVPLPVGTYKNLKVELTSGSDTWFSKTAKDMTVARNQIFIMPTITCGATPNTKQETVANSENVAADINTLLEVAATSQETESKATDLNITIAATPSASGGTEGDVASTVEVKQDVVIPQTITQASQTESETEEPAPAVILTFDAVPTSNNTVAAETGEVVENVITITDNADVPETAEESKSEVHIAIPSVEVETEEGTTQTAEAPSFNINLPTSTVTLSAKGESAKYDVVIANTAENTLRVDRGVTINKVIVGTGNIDLKGTIGDIVSGSGKPIYVFMEENAQITGTISDNVILVDARIPNPDVATAFSNESTADGIDVPYEIRNLAELRLLGVRVNEGKENKNMVPYYKCNYKLVANIFVKENVDNWMPIGSEGAPFRGTFDGGNYTVRGNFNINNGVSHGGLFGYIESATVKNLKVDGSVYYENIRPSSPYVGGIAGSMNNGSVIENCYNMAKITVHNTTETNTYAGGIVGQSNGWMSQNTNTIVACGNEGKVSAVFNGGIVSDCYHTDIFTCYNMVTDVNSICWMYSDGTNVVGCWFINYNSIGMGGSWLMSNCYWNSRSSALLHNPNVVNCGTFNGYSPNANEIDAMNEVCQSSGWVFHPNGKPEKSDKTGIPNTPVKPW